MLSNDIDMICFNQECIAYQNQLFLYGSNNRYQHSVHEDQCTNLHPFFFNRKYAKQGPVLLEIKAEFEEQLSVVIDETVQRVADALKNKLIQKSSEIYDKELDQFREENCQKMLKKLKIKRQTSQQINFINYLFLEDSNGLKDHIVKKMKKCEEQINHSLGRLDREITQELQKVIKDFDFKQEEKEKNFVQQCVKIESQEAPIHEQNKMAEEKFAEKEPVMREDNHVEEKMSKQIQNANNQRKYFKVTKTKPIHKAVNTVKQQQGKRRQSSDQEGQYSQNYSEVAKQKNVEGVCAIRGDLDWINLLKNPIDCKKLVVYYPLKEKDLLISIKKTSPKEIYINYQAQLSQRFIDGIPNPILQHIERFQEFWDENEFFDEVINNHHFPTDDFRHIYPVRKIHFSSKQLNLMPKLSNIWISNSYDLQQMKLSLTTAKQITSLRIQPCKCCNGLDQRVVTQVFKTFKESRSLKALILKCEVLNVQNSQLLRQLTKSNRSILGVILELQGKFIPNRILECFTSLPLKQLSINKERNNNKRIVYMDITPIIKIRTLRKLAMTCMSFTPQQVTNSDIDSGRSFNLDSKIADKMSNLTKLVFLDLFRCSPVYSKVVKNSKKEQKSNCII